MKIGIISTIGSGYTWAGSEETWRLFAIRAVSKGHELSIQVSDTVATYEKLSPLRDAGVKFWTRKELSGIARRLANRNLLCRFKKFMSLDHDVIFLSTGGVADCAWIPDLVSRLGVSTIPYVVFIQANAEGMVNDDRQRNILKKFYENAKSIVFLSEHNKLLAERQLVTRFPDASIVMNPLRTPVTVPSEWPNESTFKIAEVARLEVVDKQQDHLLEALSSDEWRLRNWELTFYGSGPDEGHIKRLIDFYGLTDKAKIGGFVSDFRDIWKKNHLHILPSRREGMPLSLIESMACGRAAVVTRAGGSPELIEEGVNGWVCPGMHPEVLRETLETAWDCRDKWREMGSDARGLILDKVNDDWGLGMLDIVTEAAGRLRHT